MPEKLFKVIIVGDPTVGKTAFVQRYVSNIFKKEFKGTVGVDFSLKILTYSDTQTVKLQLWDIAGKQKIFTYFQKLATLFQNLISINGNHLNYFIDLEHCCQTSH